MNTGFLARQLALTEFQGEAVDCKGGCLVLNQHLYAAIWEPEVIPDPEEYITAVQAKAEEFNTALCGLLILIPAAREKEECITALGEALYIYGYPRLEDGESGPEMVQVLNRQLKAPDGSGIEVKNVSGADDLVREALAVPESLATRFGGDGAAGLDGTDLMLASIGGEPAGICATVGSDLVSRLVLLHVIEEHRGKGVGKAMQAHCADSAAAAGKLLFSTWTHRDGQWRYYFGKLGYEEQLSAVYFRAEEQA